MTPGDRLECIRAPAATYVEPQRDIYERRWFPPLEIMPELHDVRSPWLAGARVCVLARVASEDASVWCIDREPSPEKDAPVIRTGWRRMPLGAPRAIAMGSHELCAMYSAGPVRCVTGDKVSEITGTDGAVQLVVADDFGCVRDARGLVSCWGDNSVGQLGDGRFESRRAARPIALTGAFGDLGAFGQRACAVRDGVPWCWGRLRPERSLPGLVSPTPVRAAELSDVRTLAVADWFACATRSDGTVWCWGNDATGQLGNGASMPHRGCQREGISGTSPEQEQLQPPTPVRTGEAGAYPRARAALFAFVVALVLVPLAVMVDFRKRSSLRAHAALLVATFIPMLVMRLANVTLSVWFATCRGWECSMPSFARLEHTFFAASTLVASFGFVVYGYGRFRSPTDQRRAIQLAKLVAFVAIPCLLCSMFFTRSINDGNSSDALAYLLRDRALEDITWPFTVQWLWTVAWIVLGIAFALFTWIEVADRLVPPAGESRDVPPARDYRR